MLKHNANFVSQKIHKAPVIHTFITFMHVLSYLLNRCPNSLSVILIVNQDSFVNVKYISAFRSDKCLKTATGTLSEFLPASVTEFSNCYQVIFYKTISL